MSKVYRVGGLDETEYFNTAKEADRFKPNGDEPESFEKLDAAGECNRLNRSLDETERRLDRLRLILLELVEVCPPDLLAGTNAGRTAKKYVADNPLPPADSAHRDGGRSYGGG